MQGTWPYNALCVDVVGWIASGSSPTRTEEGRAARLTVPARSFGRVARYTAGGGEHATPGDAIRRQSGSVLGQSFENGPQRDRWTASASSGLISGQSFETLEALIWGPPDFVPKLTPSERRQVSANATYQELA
jgi:hypothetical protein